MSFNTHKRFLSNDTTTTGRTNHYSSSSLVSSVSSFLSTTTYSIRNTYDDWYWYRIESRTGIEIVTYLMTRTSLITFLGYGSYKFYTWYQQYGFHGTLRYIWEGEPYVPQIRLYYETLQKTTVQYKKCQKIVTLLEESYQRAQLNSIDYDNYTNNFVVQMWQQSLPKQYRDLRQRLALISHDVDQMAAQLDQIIITTTTTTTSSNTNTNTSTTTSAIKQQSDTEKHYDVIRKQKKNMSKDVVKLMERVDQLITYYKSGSSR